jgi:hypothetical protein
VIPTAESLLAVYALYRKQRGGAPASEVAVRAAVRAAHSLVREENDEPAALLFAFATHRRAFPGGWRFMAQAIAYSQARDLGLSLHATPDDVDDLLSEVMYGTATFEDVRDWVALRLQAFE